MRFGFSERVLYQQMKFKRLTEIKKLLTQFINYKFKDAEAQRMLGEVREIRIYVWKENFESNQAK